MTTVSEYEEPKALPHREVIQVMTGLLAALFTALISNTIVATALPTIMGELHGTQRQYTWVITASLLMMTISTPIWGKMSDLFNKKTLAQVSIVLFVVGSVAAGITQSIWLLMTARAVQGIAMGGLIAMVQSIMGTIIAPRDRGRYAGYMGGTMAVATVSGPLIGGLITDNLNWRWCFFVCIPLAVIALGLIQLKLHLPQLRRRHVTIDYAGGALLAIAAALPMLWVTFAGTDFDWISGQSAAYLAGFLIAATLAVIVELRAAEPMVPIRVLRNNTTALMIVASIAIGVAMFGSAIFLTQYFQLGAGHTPTRAGLMTIPMIISQVLSATIGGQIVSRTGRWKPVMMIGSTIMLIGLGGLGTIDHSTRYATVAVFMALMGLGVGTLVQNIVLAVQNTVDVTDVGAASGTIAFFRSLGGAIGVSVLGAVLTNQVSGKIESRLERKGVPADKISGGGSGETDLDIKSLPGPIQDVIHNSYADAFGNIFLIAAIVAVTTLLAILVVREVPLRTTVTMKESDRAAHASSAKPRGSEAAAVSEEGEHEPASTGPSVLRD